jgi:two-component system, NarL family, invasion response regulator UvrY
MPGVLLIDDHPIVLQGCRTLLEEAGFGDIHEASHLAAAYRLYHRLQPQLVILDLSLQGQGLAGLGLIGRIRMRDKRTPILIFSMHRDPVIVRRALEAGATGHLLKDTAPGEFIEALRAVRSGTPFLSHQLALQVAMLGGYNRQADMTQRELQILALIAEGKPYGQIADDLGVSYKTVANGCSQLKVKLGAGNLPELVRMAIEYMATVPDRTAGGRKSQGFRDG